MAGFVDCSKYKNDQATTLQALENIVEKNEKQDEKLKELEKRGIKHDDTLTGDGLTEGTKLGVKKSTAEGNAVNTDNGVFVKDLGPQVKELEDNWKDLNNRLSGDLTNGIKAVNDKLNKLKEIEVALNAAKAEGNYKKIKDLEAQLAAAKQAEDLANKSLADAIDSLRKQGLSDTEIQKIINDSLAKAGGQGRHLTGIQVNQATGDVTYIYSDGTRLTGKLNQFQGVVVDNKTVGGNGTDKALHVKLSKADGNMLRANDDGLYLGQTSRRSVLYVDAVNGSDDNIGTREKPLKTLRYAMLTGERGDHQSIYLHEQQDHIIDALAGSISLMGRGISIYPYGEFGDEVLKANDGSGYARNLEYAKNPDKAPRVVFKNVRKQWYRPVGGEYTRARLDCIFVSGKGAINFSGVTIVNDIGFSFSVEANEVFDNRDLNFVTDSARIVLSDATSSSINVRMKTIGAPTISGRLNENASEQAKFAQLRSKNSKGLYEVSFIYGDICNVSVRNLFGLEDMEAYMYHTPGWNPRITNAFILSNQGSVDVDKLTKLTYGPTIETQPSGDKIVLAPSNNIRNSTWAAQHD